MNLIEFIDWLHVISALVVLRIYVGSNSDERILFRAKLIQRLRNLLELTST